MELKTIEWLDDKLRILDQSKLPWEQSFVDLAGYQDVALAIKEMRIRGAPAIGVAAGYGIALGAQDIKTTDEDNFLNQLNQVMQTLATTRPTAVNLFQAINRMRKITAIGGNIPEIKEALINEAKQIHQEEIEATKRLSQLGAELIQDGFTILTHCNAGSLATAGYGTALGVIKTAKEQGKRVSVIVTETRPLLQGARLTTWELKQEDIPVTLITDSMAGYFMHQNKIDCVIVGADRIAANGDVANKIGTYTLAVLAKENDIPFYVAAPTSTIDLSLPSGDKIPIEERVPDEVTHIQGIRIAPKGINVANPAFDVTPHNYITTIITEKGIIREPYIERLREIAT
ncbi:MAG: S-methyl-5-thioribose-1-phosphate isomerase [Chloroflexi bacterium CG07_land_8_20_14_0_80_45_17]|nr:MAG: S-methyl-5-thioribose-1-phosphate isomerase [Chloroflexi bacterium CG07_land_8_20_14_0_80_45_17]